MIRFITAVSDKSLTHDELVVFTRQHNVQVVVTPLYTPQASSGGKMAFNYQIELMEKADAIGVIVRLEALFK